VDTFLYILVLSLSDPSYVVRSHSHAALTKALPHSLPQLAWGQDQNDAEIAQRCTDILATWHEKVRGPSKLEPPRPWPSIELLKDGDFQNWGLGGYSFPRKMFLDKAEAKIGKCPAASRLATKLFTEHMITCYGPWLQPRIDGIVKTAQDKEKIKPFVAKVDGELIAAPK